MTEERIDKDTLLFHQLILSFHTAAWQQMGKVANPFTGKIERDLEAASYSIDMLDMVRNRMKGNLTEQEERFLTHTLSDLKLNYMDELNKSEAGVPADDNSKTNLGNSETEAK